MLGFGLGALWPTGSTGDLYGQDWAGTIRGLYFGGGHLGARSGLFYGRAKGKSGVEDGSVYGLDLDLAVRFGSKPGRGFYLFLGPGYYWTHFTQLVGSAPDASTVRVEDSSVSASAGFGYAYKAFFIEASYVNVFSQGEDVRYVPVMVGFQF
jgi:hypothetical protein